MPTPPTAASSLRPATRRVSLWGTTLLCCAALTGCASQTASLTARLDARPNETWLSQPPYSSGHDSIRDLLVKSSASAHNHPVPYDPHARLADTALKFLGVRYRFGGSDPKTGFDCSGLVTYAAEHSLGLKLPRRAADLAQQGKSVKRHELEVGDLVFFNTLGRRYSHVGIYVGDNQFVHAPTTGSRVRVERLNTRYWAQRYTGARRLDLTQLSSASPGKR